MWHNNRTVSRVYTSHHSQNAWAIISGLSGWKRIKTGATDGVTNVHAVLTAAHANNKTVDVYIVSDLIERVVMK